MPYPNLTKLPVVYWRLLYVEHLNNDSLFIQHQDLERVWPNKPFPDASFTDTVQINACTIGLKELSLIVNPLKQSLSRHINEPQSRYEHLAV